MAELLAANQITIAKVLDGADGELSAEQLAQLNQASEDASQAKTDVANLEIGGRNLVWDTEWKNISARWTNWGSPTTREIVTLNGKRWLHIVTTTTEYQGYSQGQEKRAGYGEIKAGDKIIVSCSAYAITAGQKCSVGLHWKNSSGSIVSQNWASFTLTTTEKKYVSAVFTVPNGAVGFNVMVGDSRSAAQELWISEVKLELGTKATDWTPAPEDVDAGIKDAAKVATNFINYDSTNGLVLGNKESGSWVGYRTQIDNDSFNVLDENGSIIASYGSNEVELGKGNHDAIIKMCDGKAYIKNYIVGSENTSVFCGQNTTAVGEWDGASESYAFFKQGYAYIGQSSSSIKFSSLSPNKNDIIMEGRTITINGQLALGTALSIANGGTGATTAAAARSNLGIKDYVVEKGAGTASGSYYRKWASGRAEYWHKFNPGAYTIGTARGNMYSGAYFNSNFETSLFNDVPQVNCYAHLNTDAYVIGTQVKTISKDSVTLRLWASGNIASNSGYNVHIYAFGTWK